MAVPRPTYPNLLHRQLASMTASQARSAADAGELAKQTGEVAKRLDIGTVNQKLSDVAIQLTAVVGQLNQIADNTTPPTVKVKRFAAPERAGPAMVCLRAVSLLSEVVADPGLAFNSKNEELSKRTRQKPVRDAVNVLKGIPLQERFTAICQPLTADSEEEQSTVTIGRLVQAHALYRDLLIYYADGNPTAWPPPTSATP